MTRKTFWIVFSLIVVYAAVVFSNFSTSTKLDEALRDMGGDSMPVGAYGNAMVGFYNANKRWPTPVELVLPAPPAGGIVRSVSLQPDGELVLTLSGRIWLRPIKVTVAVILQPGQDRFGWTSGCLDVSPGAIAGVIYGHCSLISRAEVQETQHRVIAAQSEDEDERTLIANDEGEPTSCHRHAEQAKASNLVACLTEIDPEVGRKVALGIENFAHSPRVTPRQLLLKPNPMEWRSQQCDEQWSMLRQAVVGAHRQAGKCFVDE